MTKPQELELFDYLARHPKFREWVSDKLVEDTGVLVQSIDIDQLRRAQGRAAVWQTMLTLLTQAPAAVNKRS